MPETVRPLLVEISAGVQERVDDIQKTAAGYLFIDGCAVFHPLTADSEYLSQQQTT